MGSEALKYLIDSDVMIDHLNGRREAGEFILEHGDESAISVITRAEVLSGLDGDNQRIVARLLDGFSAIGIDAAIADTAAAVRREKGWKLPDAFQVAIARQRGLKFVTRNFRDFPPDRFKFVLIPYR